MKEKSDKFEEIINKVKRAQEQKLSRGGVPYYGEKWRTPEEGAEELYALWRDYNRRKIRIYREHTEKEALKRVPKKRRTENQITKRAEVTVAVDADPRLAPLRAAMNVRFNDQHVREMFERNLERELAEEEKLVPTYKNYLHEKGLKNAAEARRLEIYQKIFADRKNDPEEIDQIELEIKRKEIRDAKRAMEQMERESPELSARLSFERLREYRSQLKKDGFIWTPSREELFNKILEHLVIVNQNRPFLLYGETGTGKTRLARAVSERLTGRAPFEVGEEAKTDIRPLLGFRDIGKTGTIEEKSGKTLVTYGALGEAISGKHSSSEEKAGPGGIFYMDDVGDYPPSALRALIKQVSGRRTGELVGFSAWFGNQEKVAPQFGFIMSTNLPSEKHPDRAEYTVELKREITSLEVDYPPQTNENPELYTMMLAALMDQNDRIRVSKEELPRAWKEVVDTTTQTKRFEVDDNPKSGGTLWRFANLVAHIQKSYKGGENALTSTLRDASYLRHAVLDPGLVLSWLQEYRKSAMRAGERLDNFLSRKISEWASQKIYPEEDRNLIKKFQEEFQLS